MTITGYQIGNYRCFLDPISLDLKPITVVFGYNNSGKSALVRALGLIAASIGVNKGNPIDLSAEVVRGSDFPDMSCRYGKSDEVILGLSWKSETDCETNWSYQATLTDLFAQKRLLRQQVKSFEFTCSVGPVTLNVCAEIESDQLYVENDSEITYEMRVELSGGEENFLRMYRQPVSFLGLLARLPQVIVEQTEELEPAILNYHQEFEQLDTEVQWLGALRARPTRYIELRHKPAFKMRPDGAGAAEILAYDSLGDGELVSDVSNWYEEQFDRDLTINDADPPHVQLSLTPSNRTKRPINIIDTGEGMAQLLPVLVGTALLKNQVRHSPRYLILEQPELHVHHRVHAALASRFVDVARENPKARLLIETHSENLLLGLRLAVANEEIKPGDIAIYFVNQDDELGSVAPAWLDSLGRLQGEWPEDLYAERYELSRKILEQQRLISR